MQAASVVAAMVLQERARDDGYLQLDVAPTQIEQLRAADYDWPPDYADDEPPPSYNSLLPTYQDTRP